VFSRTSDFFLQVFPDRGFIAITARNIIAFLMNFDNHLSKLGFLFVSIQTLTVVTSCALGVCKLGLFEGGLAEVVSFVRGPRYQEGCEPLLCLNASILYTDMTDCQ
jgi:hypothetical protein